MSRFSIDPLVFSFEKVDVHSLPLHSDSPRWVPQFLNHLQLHVAERVAREIEMFPSCFCPLAIVNFSLVCVYIRAMLGKAKANFLR